MTSRRYTEIKTIQSQKKNQEDLQLQSTLPLFA